MEDRKVAFVAKNEALANVIKGMLAANGIESIILDQKDEISNMIGQYEIHVASKDEASAKALIAEHNA